VPPWHRHTVSARPELRTLADARASSPPQAVPGPPSTRWLLEPLTDELLRHRRRPKPFVLELQCRSAKPHPSRLDAGPSALRRRLHASVSASGAAPLSPIAPLFHAASRRRAKPPARRAEHQAGPCYDSPSCPGAICAPHASAPVSTSSRQFHRHQASLPLSCSIYLLASTPLAAACPRWRHAALTGAARAQWYSPKMMLPVRCLAKCLTRWCLATATPSPQSSSYRSSCTDSSSSTSSATSSVASGAAA
jgi:hypothetical protein